MRSMSRLLPPSCCAFRDSSAHNPCCSLLYRRQFKRTCLTVRFHCLHSQRPSSIPGTFRSKRNCRRPLFPVRICITNELSSLLSPGWSFTMLLFDFGSSLYSSRPRVSFLHLSFHWADALLPKTIAFAETSSFTSGVCAAVEPVSNSLVPPLLVFFNLHPVAVEVDKIIRIVLSSLGPMSPYIHEPVS